MKKINLFFLAAMLLASTQIFAQIELKKLASWGINGKVKYCENKFFSANFIDGKYVKIIDNEEFKTFSKFNALGYPIETLDYYEDQLILEKNIFNNTDSILIEHISEFADEDISVISKFSYDNKNNIILESVFYGINNDTIQTNEYLYDENNLKTEANYFSYDENNIKVWNAADYYAYDDMGKLLSIRNVVALEQNDKENVASTVVVKYYDDNGILEVDTTFDNNDNAVLCKAYSASGKIEKSYELMYDFDGQEYWELIEDNVYDEKDRLILSISGEALSSIDRDFKYKYIYNEHGLIETIEIINTDKNTSSVICNYSYEYDNHGNWIVKYSSEKDIDSNDTRYSVIERVLEYFE